MAMNKYLTIIAALFLTTALCPAQPKKASFQYGPWIQNVTETGFTVVFKTPEPTLAFVEVAPEDGSSMYNSDLHRFYETVAGRRTSGTLHKIRVTGLEPPTGTGSPAKSRLTTATRTVLSGAPNFIW